MNQLRALLGTRHRNHLAVEEIDPTAPQASSEDATVVMKGPLADVYSDALMKTYDKDAPPVDPAADPAATADPSAATEPAAETGAIVDTTNLVPKQGETQETVEAAIISEVGSIVLESQAIDAAVAQGLADAMSDEAPSDGTEYETMYAIDETQVTAADVKDVTAILADTDKHENVTVMIDNVVPEDVIDTTNPAMAEAKELALGLESIVIAMGGKVVRGFPAYLASRRK